MGKLLDKITKLPPSHEPLKTDDLSAAALPPVPPRGNLDDELIAEARRKEAAFEFSITPNLAASESTGSVVDDLQKTFSRLGVTAKITIHF